MNKELVQRADVAERIIREAGELALNYFDSVSELTIESKGLQDRVSEADRNVEKFIRDGLLGCFPQDGFLGEESGATANLDDDEFIWVIDPIDGTDCFVHGIPVWCLSVALVRGNSIEAGLIFNPNANELFRAVRGQGATCNGSPIKVSGADSITAGMIGVGFSHRVNPKITLVALDALCAAGGIFQRNGSAALTLAYVASGRYLGFFEGHINSWDVLAGLALVYESGGWSNPFLSSESLRRGNLVVAGAPGIETELREICGSILSQDTPY
ncbi:MAG: inositol monophosphatase [Gammaproteobacteria bacterium]|nr:inositol monophosphatase [Gammaproteobacteria bacterium]